MLKKEVAGAKAALGLFCFLVSCATLPVTEQVRETDRILQSPVFAPAHVITEKEKRDIKTVLENNDTALRQSQADIAKAQERAADNEKMAKVGRWTIGVGIAAGVLCLLALIAKICSFFKILP